METEPTAGLGSACVPNIDGQERRRRLLFGVATLALGVLVLLALVLTGQSRWWRLSLVLAFYPAALGFFQWNDHTCVALAAREERKIGPTAERIEDAGELSRVRAQARRVQAKALASGLALVVVALVV